jgi:hypothetical protein
MKAGGQLSRVEAWELADALTAALARQEAFRDALSLADAALRGANMDMKVVHLAVTRAIALQVQP